MPLLLNTSHAHEPALREAAVEQLALLVSIVKLHVRKYLPSLLSLAQENLRSSGLIQMHTLTLLEQLSIALGGEFREPLRALMPRLLAIPHADCSDRRLPTLKLLHALDVFGHNLAPQLHTVVPAVLRLCAPTVTYRYLPLPTVTYRYLRGAGQAEVAAVTYRYLPLPTVTYRYLPLPTVPTVRLC